MRTMMKTIAAVGMLALGAGTAAAQGMPNCVGRPDFDNCMRTWNQGNMNRVAQSQQQLMRNYVAANTPRIQQEYAQLRGQGSPLSFAQYVNWRIMTRNGEDPGNLQRAQQNQLAGQLRANQTVQQGYADYRRAMAENSNRNLAAVERYSTGAIRGQAPYAGPGGTVMLPYSQPSYQPFNSGGEMYTRDGQGNYYVRQGNGWVPMTAGNNR
jgi:hypothetical protein